jgi:hypothetical protein
MFHRPALASLVALALSLSACSKKDSPAGTGGGTGDGGQTAAHSGGGGGGLLSFLSSGSPFEGEIALSMQEKKSGKPPVNLVYQVKPPKMRLDVPPEAAPQTGGAPSGRGAKSVWMLIDPPQKKMWAITDDDKKAIVFDMSKMADEAKKLRGGGAAAGGGASNKPPPKITKTGKTDEVAGYECELWEMEEQTRKVSVCAAKGITWFDMRSLGGFDPKAALLSELTDANHFPLRVVATEDGVETERMEATRIQKKGLDDARFQVPAGYQEIDLSQMLQGLGNMVPGGPGGAGLQPHPPARHK